MSPYEYETQGTPRSSLTVTDREELMPKPQKTLGYVVAVFCPIVLTQYSLVLFLRIGK